MAAASVDADRHADRRDAQRARRLRWGPTQGRSVFLLQELSARPTKKRRRLLDRHEKMTLKEGQ